MRDYSTTNSFKSRPAFIVKEEFRKLKIGDVVNLAKQILYEVESINPL